MQKTKNQLNALHEVSGLGNKEEDILSRDYIFILVILVLRGRYQTGVLLLSRSSIWNQNSNSLLPLSYVVILHLEKENQFSTFKHLNI